MTSTSISFPDSHAVLLAVRAELMVMHETHLAVLAPSISQVEGMYRATATDDDLEESIPGMLLEVRQPAGNQLDQRPFQDQCPRLGQVVKTLASPGKYREGRSGQMMTRRLLEQLTPSEAKRQELSTRDHLVPHKQTLFSHVAEVEHRLQMVERPRWNNNEEFAGELTFMYPRELARAWLYSLRRQPEALDQAFRVIRDSKPKVAGQLLEEDVLGPTLDQESPSTPPPTLILTDTLSDDVLVETLQKGSPELRQTVLRASRERKSGRPGR